MNNNYYNMNNNVSDPSNVLISILSMVDGVTIPTRMIYNNTMMEYLNELQNTTIPNVQTQNQEVSEETNTNNTNNNYDSQSQIIPHIIENLNIIINNQNQNQNHNQNQNQNHNHNQNQNQNQNMRMNILNLLERTSHYNYQNTNSLQSIINSTLNDKSLYKKVLSDKGKSSLTKVIYLNNPEQFPNDKCPITYIQFEDNQEITQLPCKHCFDTEAINKWLKEEKAECPVCRFKLHAKEEKITSENQLQTQTNTNVADPHPPISETRATFFNSLSRLPIHPFGPRNQTTNIPIPGQLSFHRIANIFNQQDDNADLQQALYDSIQNNNDNDPSTIDE